MSGVSSFERDLLAAVAALPLGEKLPISRIARDLNCSSSVVIAGVAALVMCGAINEATLRPPVVAGPSALLAEVEAFLAVSGMAPTRFGKEACGAFSFVTNLRAARTGPQAKTVARVRAFMAGWGKPGSVPVDAAGDEDGRNGVAVPRQRPSGAELAARLRAATASARVPMHEYLAPLTNNCHTYLSQLERAKRPTALTVDRIDALIAGREVAPGPDRDIASEQYRPRAVRDAEGLPPSGRAVREDRIAAANAERREANKAKVQIAELARARRLPGETVAAAVAREAEEQGERRRNARESKGVRGLETSRERFARLAGEVEAELASEAALERDARHERELDELVSPSSVLRRAQRDWPLQCERVKAIAAEMGVSLGEAWRRVIGAGVDCLQECEG